MVVSVLTQYRILKFVSVNVKETQMLRKPLRDLHVGSYENLSYAHMDSPVIEVIQALVKRSISCVPILDKDGMVLNVFEAVDVIALIKGGDYDNLQLTVGKALEKRSDVSISLQHYHPHITSTLANSYFRRTSPAFTPAPSTTASTPSSTPSANPACTASSSSTSEATSWACSR
jgi:hypothetical protein